MTNEKVFVVNGPTGHLGDQFVANPEVEELPVPTLNAMFPDLDDDEEEQAGESEPDGEDGYMLGNAFIPVESEGLPLPTIDQLCPRRS